MRRFLPWLLLGLLGLTTGLGIGLGVAYGPTHHPAPHAGREPQVRNVAATLPIAPASAPSPPSTPTTGQNSATTSVPSAALCHADQLQIRFVGEQGATGNVFAAFWIADVSRATCVLESSVSVELLGRDGVVQLRAALPMTQPLTLTGPASVPTDNMVPTNAQLAFVTLAWPTVADVSNSGVCPQALFTPSAMRVAFANVGSDLLSNLDSNGQTISICGPNIRIEAVGPLGH